MIAIAGVELETLVSEPYAMTTRPPLSDFITEVKCLWPDFRTMDIP